MENIQLFQLCMFEMFHNARSGHTFVILANVLLKPRSHALSSMPRWSVYNLSRYCISVHLLLLSTETGICMYYTLI